MNDPVRDLAVLLGEHACTDEQWRVDDERCAAEILRQIRELRAENAKLRAQPLGEAMVKLQMRCSELEAKLSTPPVEDFAKSVMLEVAHQRARWGPTHDENKNPEDWFWLLGYLSGKALRAHASAHALSFKASLTTGEFEKSLHHCISSAAVLAQWHAAILVERDARRRS